MLPLWRASSGFYHRGEKEEKRNHLNPLANSETQLQLCYKSPFHPLVHLPAKTALSSLQKWLIGSQVPREILLYKPEVLFD
jgi:hypothetical protein